MDEYCEAHVTIDFDSLWCGLPEGHEGTMHQTKGAEGDTIAWMVVSTSPTL